MRTGSRGMHGHGHGSGGAAGSSGKGILGGKIERKEEKRNKKFCKNKTKRYSRLLSLS